MSPDMAPQGGAPPVQGEALSPRFGKDLSRDSTGNRRFAQRRGTDEIPGFSEEEDFAGDDMLGIEDLLASFTEVLKYYKEMEARKTSIIPDGMNEELLQDYFGKNTTERKPIMLKETLFAPAPEPVLLDESYEDEIRNMDQRLDEILTEASNNEEK